MNNPIMILIGFVYNLSGGIDPDSIDLLPEIHRTITCLYLF